MAGLPLRNKSYTAPTRFTLTSKPCYSSVPSPLPTLPLPPLLSRPPLLVASLPWRDNPLLSSTLRTLSSSPPPVVLLYHWRLHRALSHVPPFARVPLHPPDLTTSGPIFVSLPTPSPPPCSLLLSRLPPVVLLPWATTPSLPVAVSSVGVVYSEDRLTAKVALPCETAELGLRQHDNNHRTIVIHLLTATFRPDPSSSYPHSSSLPFFQRSDEYVRALANFAER